MYQYIATAQVAVIAILIYAVGELVRKRNDAVAAAEKAQLRVQADEALLRSLHSKIEALDEDFTQAIQLSVEQIAYWSGVAKGLANEIRQTPDFASHLQGNGEGCTLCTLIAQTEKA